MHGRIAHEVLEKNGEEKDAAEQPDRPEDGQEDAQLKAQKERMENNIKNIMTKTELKPILSMPICNGSVR